MSDENCCGACGYPIHATKDKACDWCRQTADRIEALTEQLEAARADAKEAEAYAEELCGQISELNDKVADWSVRAEAAEAKLATCEKYRDAYDKMGRIGTEAYRDLEANLAKAVEFIQEVRRNGDTRLASMAIATLAEIEGGKG